VPAGASFFELPDGRLLAATDGADTIVAASDGRSLQATYRRLAVVGSATGAWVEPGFEVTVAWRLDGQALVRRETLVATRDVTLRRLSLSVTSTATNHSAGPDDTVSLRGPEGVLRVQAGGALSMTRTVRSFGDEPLGRGPRLPIPTHVAYEANDVQLRQGQPVSWEIRLTPALSNAAAPR
jgi:hypothetical protein